MTARKQIGRGSSNYRELLTNAFAVRLNPLTSTTVDFLAGFPANEEYVPTCAIAREHRFHRNSDV